MPLSYLPPPPPPGDRNTSFPVAWYRVGVSRGRWSLIEITDGAYEKRPRPLFFLDVVKYTVKILRGFLCEKLNRTCVISQFCFLFFAPRQAGFFSFFPH